jgi:membrane protein YdbS with pleckstrin-like domain
MSQVDLKEYVSPNIASFSIGFLWFLLLTIQLAYGVKVYDISKAFSLSENVDNIRYVFVGFALFHVFIARIFKHKAYQAPAHLTSLQFFRFVRFNLVLSWMIGVSMCSYAYFLGVEKDYTASVAIILISILWHFMNVPKVTWLKEELLKYNQLKDLNLSDD